MEWHDVDTLASDPSNRNIARILAAIGRAWVPTDDLRTWAYNLLDLEPDARLVDVLEQARAAIHILNRVHDIVETQEYDDVAASERLEEARHRAHFLREYLLNEAAVRQCGESHFPPSLKLYSEAKDKEGPFPTLLKHLLRRLHALKYRRVDDQCYSERRTDDDYDSHAYVQACSIQQFILDECDKDTSPDMWDILNAKDNSLKKQLHDYLCNSRDREFVQLEPNRGILSFQNGLYVLGQHMFYPFADRANWVRLAAQEDTARGNIGTYDPPCAPTRTDVALNFFDARFPVEYMHDPLSVPTPLIDKILLAQQLTDETRHCIWVFLGRLLYNLRDKDNWVVRAGAAAVAKASLTLPHVPRSLSSSSWALVGPASRSSRISSSTFSPSGPPRPWRMATALFSRPFGTSFSGTAPRCAATRACSRDRTRPTCRA